MEKSKGLVEKSLKYFVVVYQRNLTSRDPYLKEGFALFTNVPIETYILELFLHIFLQ